MRLKQAHSKNVYEDREDLDPLAIVASQRLLPAMIASLVVVCTFTALSILLASLFGRIFPWVVVVQGAALGIAIRRWGRGFDWRFGTLGAVAGFAGAYIGNLLIAASVAGDDLGISTLSVIANMSQYTLGTFFAEDVSPADHIFAVFAAVFAAFFARRQLSRDEYRALRLMQDSQPTQDRST